MSDGSTQLGDLKVEVEGAAKALGQELAQGTTFAGLATGGAGSDGDLFPKALDLSGTDTLPLGGTSLALGGSAAYQVYALTGSFTDPDGIESPQPAGAPDGAAAWLKHELKTTVTASGSGSVSGGSVGLDAGKTARLLDYRRHAPTDLVAPAVLAEIAKPRLPNRIADLQAMAAGDAVAFVVAGSFAFRASFTYSDLLPATVSSLDKALGVVGAAAFTVTVGGTVEADLSANDALRLVFTRGTALDLAVDLKKAKASNLSGSASLGAKASFTNPAQLAKLVESYLAGRLEVAYPNFQSLLAKLNTATDVSQLSATEQKLLQAIVTKLNLGDVVTQFTAIKTKLEALPGDLQKKLETVLSQQLSLTFSLSYSRVKTEETLASFEAKAASLAPFLHPLLTGDMRGIAAKIAAGDPGFVCKNYLFSRQITQQLSFGVNLSFGPWVAKGQTTTTFSESQQENVARELRLSFDGEETYASQWGDQNESYGFALTAAMPGFAAKPAGKDFTFGAGLHWAWEQSLTPTLRDRILDLGNVWGVFPPDANASQASALAGLLGKTVRAEISLTLSDAAVRALANVPDAQYQAAWVRAMAASLPRVALPNTSFKVDLRQRLALYPGAAAAAFGQKDAATLTAVPAYGSVQPPLSAADLHQLRQVDLPSGTSLDNNATVYSLPALWRPESSTVNMFHSYQRALGAFRRLGSFLAGNASYQVIQGVFTDLASLAGQQYLARLLGALFSQVLSQTAPATGALTVTPKDGGDAIVITGKP
jgi:hypothetical protein